MAGKHSGETACTALFRLACLDWRSPRLCKRTLERCEGQQRGSTSLSHAPQCSAHAGMPEAPASYIGSTPVYAIRSYSIHFDPFRPADTLT